MHSGEGGEKCQLFLVLTAAVTNTNKFYFCSQPKVSSIIHQGKRKNVE